MQCGLDAHLHISSTEQIKPEHIVGEDSLDNDEDQNKGEILQHLHNTLSSLVQTFSNISMPQTPKMTLEEPLS